jgi:hypothetical protein
MQPALLRYYGNAIKLIVTQHTKQELLRYHGNATNSLLCNSNRHVTIETPSRPNISQYYFLMALKKTPW